MDTGLVSRAAERVLGIAPRHVAAIPTAGDSIVCDLDLGDRRAIFKADRASVLRSERWIGERVGTLGVPVAAFLALDESPPDFPTAFAIVERIPGAALGSMSLSEAVDADRTADVGRLLRLVHGIEVDGFGWLSVGPDGAAKGWNADWFEMMRDEVDWSLPYVLKHGLLGGDPIERAGRVFLEHEASLRGVGARSLLHGDIRPDHVFVADGIVTGILDFQGRVGDPVYDIAKWSLLGGPGGLDAVLEGYGADEGILAGIAERLDVYVLVEALGILRWLHERDTRNAALVPELQRIVHTRVRALAG